MVVVVAAVVVVLVDVVVVLVVFVVAIEGVADDVDFFGDFVLSSASDVSISKTDNSNRGYICICCLKGIADWSQLTLALTIIIQ